MHSLSVGETTKQLVQLVFGSHPLNEWGKLEGLQLEEASESVKARIAADFPDLRLEVKLPVLRIALEYGDPSFIAAITAQLHPFDVSYFTRPLYQTYFFLYRSDHVRMFARMFDAHFSGLDLFAAEAELAKWLKHFHLEMSDNFLDNAWYYFWENGLAFDDYCATSLAYIFDQNVRDINTQLQIVSTAAEQVLRGSLGGLVTMPLKGKDVMSGGAIRSGVEARLEVLPRGKLPVQAAERDLFRRATDIALWEPSPPLR